MSGQKDLRNTGMKVWKIAVNFEKAGIERQSLLLDMKISNRFILFFGKSVRIVTYTILCRRPPPTTVLKKYHKLVEKWQNC